MKLSTKFAVALAGCSLWVLTVAIAFEVGGRIGHAIGSDETRSWEAVSRGIDAHRTLVRLPEGSPIELQESLERNIDYALINYLSLVDRSPSRFDMFPHPLDPCDRLSALASHRADNQSVVDNPRQLKMIEEAVNRLSLIQSAANPRRNCKNLPAA